jgi:hypothetical protein
VTYSLRRTRDGAGDSGSSMIINRRHPETSEYEFVRDVKPRVGWGVQVGSFGARSFVEQDYWQTTYVTEILEEREDYVRFKTGNSEYEWTIF